MGTAWSSEGREVLSSPDARGRQEGTQFLPPMGRAEQEDSQPPMTPSFDCSICLEVLHQPVRTRCGHVFCHSCITTSLRNNTWKCPYCRTHLHSEGIPATDITMMMENTYRNCTECDTNVCLSEMRAHLRTCKQYIEEYGPLQEIQHPMVQHPMVQHPMVQHPITRYCCPSCQCALDENDILDHFVTHHRFENRAVFCPVCHSLSESGPSYSSNSFIRHFQLRHMFYYGRYDEDYIHIDIVQEALTERVLDESFSDYIHVNNPNTAEAQ